MHLLLDVFGQTRHEILAVLVQRLALFLVLVGRVDDSGLELGRLVAKGILQCRLDIHSAPLMRGLRTRMLGVSALWPATSFARRAVEAKARTAARGQPEARATAPNGRATANRRAMVS